MQLNELVAGLGGKTYNFQNVLVRSLEYDSRKVKPGSVFIALRGEKFDGHDFIGQAQHLGVIGFITEKRVETKLPQVVFDDTRMIMGKLAKRFYGSFNEINKIGITGTNGKTTTAFLIHSILKMAGRKPGLVGTIYYLGNSKTKASRTTPESLELFKLMSQAKHRGAKDMVIEVSSHGLSLKRVDEIRFQVAVFTNFSQDHLDFHKTIKEYKQAKLHLFELLDRKGFAIFNFDDPVSRDIKRLALKRTITYGMRNNADIKARIIEENLSGLKIEVAYKNKRYRINSKLIGPFNGYNILASFATGIAMGIEQATIIQGIEQFESVKGRMAQVGDNIFVDFAHTPEALQNVLAALKKYTEGRLIVLFGCGGDRDQNKRAKMGRIASTLADFTILTSDNPRYERPRGIIKDIEKGMVNNRYKIIEDRRAAINCAINFKKNTDILLIAGKGHEEYQIFKDRIIAFDDARVVRECIRNS